MSMDSMSTGDGAFLFRTTGRACAPRGGGGGWCRPKEWHWRVGFRIVSGRARVGSGTAARRFHTSGRVVVGLGVAARRRRGGRGVP
jgi:hypothetical protein